MLIRSRFFGPGIGVLLLAASLVFSPVGSEAYLYDGWEKVSPLLDSGVDKPPGNGAETANLDILRAYHGSDASNHYFRIDLQTVPGSGNFVYGIAIDAGKTGVTDYLSVPGLNADFLLTGSGRATTNDDQSTALEWMIARETVGSRFDWAAFSYRPKGQGAYDLTPNTTVTPIPGAAWLFTSGIVALAALRTGIKKRS